MRFAYPYFLLLLALLPIWVKIYKSLKNRAKTGIRFPSLRKIKKIREAPSVKFRHVPFILRICAAAFIIIALARPQTGDGFQQISRDGIDIMLALDISTSMDVMDVKPSRLEAAKKAIGNFIENRTNDRIGLILFAGSSFTKCPLTLDYAVLKSFITPIKSGILEDGTAIGMAIANGVNRLKESSAKSKIVILLTDGVNNRGLIDPRSAIELAVGEKIKVYTIGLGQNGSFLMDIDDPRFGRRRVRVNSEIDEKLLNEIADSTGARYFSAKNQKELEEIYTEINRLEKSKVKSRIYYEYTEQFAIPAGLAIFLLVSEWLAHAHFLRRLP